MFDNFFPLIFNQFSHCGLYPLSLILLLCTSQKNKTILSVTHLTVKVENLLFCPPFPQLSFLFFTLSKPCCFSISSYILSSTCLTIVMELRCTPFDLLLSVLFWTAHSWTQYSSCCLTNHVLQLSGQTFPDTVQDAVALCSRDKLLTCVQVDVH